MGTERAWVDFTRMLRSEVERAGLANWHSLKRNASALVFNARSYVRPDVDLDASFARTALMCEQFADEIAARGVFYQAADQSSKNAREGALGAIDELEQRLSDARPSDMAVNLGVGW